MNESNAAALATALHRATGGLVDPRECREIADKVIADVGALVPSTLPDADAASMSCGCYADDPSTPAYVREALTKVARGQKP